MPRRRPGWIPVFRPETRQNKDVERIQEKWTPVFRPNARQNKDLRAHSGKVKTDILGRLRGIIRNGPTKARRNKKKPTRVNGAI